MSLRDKPPVSPQLIKKFDEIEAQHVLNHELASVVANAQQAEDELLPGITPVWHGALREMEVAEPSWVVDQLISKGGINAISGLPESHKSFIALEMGKAMALGIPFLGKFPTECGKLLLLDEENSLGRSKMRLNLLSDEVLGIAIVAGQHIKIDKPGVTEAIIRYCHANKIGVVLFDSLSSIHTADESNNPQMSKVFEQLLRLVQAGLTVIFIHHEPKSSGGDPSKASLRGAGDILAKCDTHISFRHPPNDVNTVIAKQLKNRDAERLPEFTIAVHREEDRTWFEYIGEAPKRVGAARRTDDAIIELLTTDGELYQKQIVDALSVIDGIGGEKKIAERLNDLTKTKLNSRKADHGKIYYSLKPELTDE